MAGDNDEQHAERHDHDVAVLQHQIGEIERLQQRAVGHDLEEQHDRKQRQQHAVIAQIVLDEAGVRRLRERNRLVGHIRSSPSTSFLAMLLLRMMARMILSWVASAAANSPTMAPSFMTQMRSQTPSSSGISDEIITSPLPASASSLMIQ